MTTAKEKSEEIWRSYAMPNEQDFKLSEIDGLKAFKKRIERALIEAKCEGLRDAAVMASDRICGCGDHQSELAEEIRQRADEIEKSIGGNVADKIEKELV